MGQFEPSLKIFLFLEMKISTFLSFLWIKSTKMKVRPYFAMQKVQKLLKTPWNSWFKAPWLNPKKKKPCRNSHSASRYVILYCIYFSEKRIRVSKERELRTDWLSRPPHHSLPQPWQMHNCRRRPRHPVNTGHHPHHHHHHPGSGDSSHMWPLGLALLLVETV